MNDKTLKVTAKITAVQGKENELKEILLKPIKPTRNEPACQNSIL